MKDAVSALRHAGVDIADAARLISVDATSGVRANAAAARDEAARQVAANAAAARDEAKKQIRRNAAAARKEAKKQIHRNAAALRAGAATIPDDLLPAGRDAIRKSMDRVVPARRQRSRRRPLLSALTVLAVTGLALLGVQMLLTRRSTPAIRHTGWARRAQGAPATTPSGTVDTLGMAGSVHPPVGLPPDEATQPATFDRDAGIRAATEGMEQPAPWASSDAVPPTEPADGA